MIKEEQTLSDVECFREITHTMSDVYTRKNHDYGDSFQKMFKKHGMSYPIIHLEEKLNRIEVLAKEEGMVKEEGIIDSLLDLANYSIMTIMEFKRKKDE